MRTRLAVCVVLVASLLRPGGTSAQSGPDLRLQPGQNWLTNGGNLGNQRYSTLDKITVSNVANLKGAWMTHLGSGLDAKYSLEAAPIVQDGVMYVTTGNDNVLALNARTGSLAWQYDPEIDQKITTVCCGWANRGLALGDGRAYEGLLDGTVLALDQKSGALLWRVQLCQWEQGCTITSAPAFYNGTIYIGISGGEYGIRGRLTALNAATGDEVWRF
jgi:quinohemoprotein ethanol dehydrogenase